MARLRFTRRYPSSDCRKFSVNPFLREIIATGLEGPDKAKYQHQGWAKLEYRSGPGRSIELIWVSGVRCFQEAQHFLSRQGPVGHAHLLELMGDGIDDLDDLVVRN